MKKLLIIIFLAQSTTIFPQQALWGREEITSPEVHDDNTVTFRLNAPKAKEVKIMGDWMPVKEWTPVPEKMSKNENGIWTYTTDNLPSDLYSYSFIVDSLTVKDPNNVYLIRDVSSVSNVFIIGNGKGDNYKVNDVPHGTVTRRWYESPGNEKHRRLTVYTPPGYESNNQEYPVLYLLHGMGGDEEAWIALGRTAQIMDNLIAQGKAEPMIVVMPNGNIAQEAAPGESSKGFYKPTMQLPNTMDGQMEKTFPEIIDFVEKNYRVQENKDGRAIAGLSMGGFHSLHISRYYPNTFDYVGLFSAAIMPPKEQESSDVYQYLNESLVTQKNNNPKLYWIGIGKTDFLYENVQDYKDRLDKIEMPYEYVETEGGHTWTNWRDYLVAFAPKLFK